MTIDAGASVLEHYLAHSDWEVHQARHVTARHGDRLTSPTTDALLVYVFGGSATLTRERRAVPVDAGDLLLLRDAAAVLRAVGDADVLLASLSRVRAPRGVRELPDAVLLTAFGTRESAVASLLGALGTCPTEPRPGDDQVCARIATTILTVAIRLWATQGCAPEGWPARVADPLLARALDAIHADLAHEWTVAELATRSTMSRSTFAARFRAELGRPPLEYVTAARMEEAKHLLAAGTAVSEASRLLGFASDEGFRRAFRRHTGMAPSSWPDARAVVNSTPPTRAATPAMTPSVSGPNASTT